MRKEVSPEDAAKIFRETKVLHDSHNNSIVDPSKVAGFATIKGNAYDGRSCLVMNCETVKCHSLNGVYVDKNNELWLSTTSIGPCLFQGDTEEQIQRSNEEQKEMWKGSKVSPVIIENFVAI